MRMGQKSIGNRENRIRVANPDYFRASGCYGAYGCSSIPGYSRISGGSRVPGSCKASDSYRESREVCQKRMELGRRKRILHRSVLVSTAVFFTICVIVICTALCGSLRSNANNGFKYYTSIIIQPGETLWELADQYIDYDNYKDKQSYISEVMNINHLEEDVICAGQVLIVPYYSSEYIY